MPKKKKDHEPIYIPRPHKDFLDRYWLFEFVSYYPRGGLADVSETNNDLQFLLEKPFDHSEDWHIKEALVIFESLTK
jgi:hypothetical protein